MKRILFLLLALCSYWSLASSTVRAELRLATIFSDHMVIQRDQPIRIWGWSEKQQVVKVEFSGQVISTTADDTGAWKITFKKGLAASSEPRKLSVRTDSAERVIEDIVIGDVWHASGQSNMAMTVNSVARRLPAAAKHIAEAKTSGIRFRRIHAGPATQPQLNVPNGSWQTCSPATVKSFSAAAYYFARSIHAELNIPIGIIDSSRGGTPIEPFIPREAFTSHPTLRAELELGDKDDLAAIWRLAGGVRARDANWLPGRLFQSQTAPITRLAVRGVIWYQGESNCGVGEDPRDYEHKMRALISGWRKAIENDALPFYFVQLPGSGAREGWPYLREQQRLASNMPHSGMAVTIDLLDHDIHPLNKVDVGRRLAKLAIAGAYGKDIPFSGPSFSKAEINGDTVTAHFNHADNGLVLAVKKGISEPVESSDIELSHFELAEADGKWYPATAKIHGKTVVVKSKDVSAPKAVRYGYAIDPQHCHLYNRDGLPASPFCSSAKYLTFVPDIPQK
ncbi:MAG: sialate O-acetylesterase [Pirellulaceae bacterium]|jgi:sialate O-acetylesterase